MLDTIDEPFTDEVLATPEQVLESVLTHNGRMTLHNPATGQHRTFQIRTQREDAKFAPGKRVVALLTGPDNQTDYQPFAFVDDNGIYVWSSKRNDEKAGGSRWSKFADMLMYPAKYQEHGVEYLFETRCRKCNRPLTDPISIKLGIGPKCRGDA